MLLQCAHTVSRMTSHGAKQLQQFFVRIAQRRGKKIVVVALAHKLLTTAYGVEGRAAVRSLETESRRWLTTGISQHESG